MVVHVNGAFSVDTLFQHASAMEEQLSHVVPRIMLSARIEKANRWRDVVVTDIPGDAVREAVEEEEKDFVDRLFNTFGPLGGDRIRRVIVLCKKGEYTSKEVLSLRLSVDADEADIDQLLRSGVYVGLNHCRVSPYRPRRGAAT